MIDTPSPARPIAPGLFTDEAAPRLIGGRNRDSGRIVFPCPEGAEGELYEPILLARQGTLWSWTVQRFRPKTPPYLGPAAFEPFAVGYVELADEVIVETRLTDVAFDALGVGMPLELVLLPLPQDEGPAVLTFAFRPTGESHA